MKSTISCLILLGTLATLPLGASADSCPACDKAESLAKEIKTLNYAKSDDRYNGQEKAGEATLQLSKFAKLPKSTANRQKLFKSLLGMAREAGPYDGESSLADQLATLISKDDGLKREYMDYIKSAPKAPRAEYCKSRRMQTSVEEDKCFKGAGVNGQDSAKSKKLDEQSKMCAQPFSFESCLAGK